MAFPVWLLVLLTFGAVGRLSVLIVDDYITAPLRSWTDDRASRGRGAWRWFDYLLNCPWCVSMWLGLAVGAAVYFEHAHWWVKWPLLALSASYVHGLISERRADG